MKSLMSFIIIVMLYCGARSQRTRASAGMVLTKFDKKTFLHGNHSMLLNSSWSSHVILDQLMSHQGITWPNVDLLLTDPPETNLGKIWTNIQGKPYKNIASKNESHSSQASRQTPLHVQFANLSNNVHAVRLYSEHQCTHIYQPATFRGHVPI